MAIEKLYLTDTFRTWAEKFNATIDASNAATANAEEAVNKANEAVNKANEAIEKAESAAPKKHNSPNNIYGLGSNLNYGHVRGDGNTTNVIDGEIVVKNVLYDNRVSLAKSGLLGTVKYIAGSSQFNIDTEDFDILLLHAHSNTGTNPPGFNGWLLIRQYFFARTTDLSVCSRKQITFGFYSNEMFTRYFKVDVGWSPWVKFVNETNLATTSTPGIVKPDNTTITVQNGIISAKAVNTIKDTPVFNNDFNNLTDSGVYFIQTTQGITQNTPIDITAYWWVKVTAAVEADGFKNVLQEARLHSTDSGGAAYSLARCKGTNWGPWEYAYTQFAG